MAVRNFQVTFLMVILGLYHGLICLPLILELSPRSSHDEEHGQDISSKKGYKKLRTEDEEESSTNGAQEN